MKKLVLIICSLATLSSCSKNIDPENEQPTYLLASSTQNSTGGGWVSNNYVVNYEYNTNNQLFRSITSSKNKSTSDESNGLSTTTYSYNEDGFVTSAKSDMNSGGKDTRDISTTNIQYTYQKGRLSQEVSNNTYERTTFATGKKEISTYQTTTSYTYDSKGSLTQILQESVSSSSGTSKSTTFLSGGKITKKVYQSGNGPEMEYDTYSNGLIVQNKYGTSTNFYKYDAADHLIKTERWESGKQYSYTEQTFDSQKATYLANPTSFFKGWPKYVNSNGNYSNNVLNTRIVYIQPNGSESSADHNYTNNYQFNEKGFPAKKTYSGKWNGTNYSGEEIYTYIDLSAKK
ncbi:hypothetical protein [Emticicia sp. C21]|uniref:hypothetical protein n=1 Tax=Emticicia sp. C21 TaxID=2302915 RepID=UPI000E345875|nr:hypothetical protein [Emticicia sp. C21]RFS14763.1 hypothetical protein D0T08_19055 [Emticicia sp. C21]